MLHLPATTMHAVLERLACDMQAAAKDQCYTGELLGLLMETKGLRRSSFARMQIEEVERHLTRRAGILALVSPTAYHYRFLHASFREHLAACELTHKEPANRQPPVAAERRFPGGMLHYVRENPQHWWNVAHLAADELMAQGRENELWALLAEMCQPYALHGQQARTACWRWPLRRSSNRSNCLTPAGSLCAWRRSGRWWISRPFPSRRSATLRAGCWGGCPTWTPGGAWEWCGRGCQRSPGWKSRAGRRPFPVPRWHTSRRGYLLDRPLPGYLRSVSGIRGRKAGLCG